MGMFSDGMDELIDVNRNLISENKKLKTKIEKLKERVLFLQDRCGNYETVLALIATPKRADGTYNRCREACEELAKKALSE